MFRVVQKLSNKEFLVFDDKDNTIERVPAECLNVVKSLGFEVEFDYIRDNCIGNLIAQSPIHTTKIDSAALRDDVESLISLLGGHIGSKDCSIVWQSIRHWICVFMLVHDSKSADLYLFAMNDRHTRICLDCLSEIMTGYKEDDFDILVWYKVGNYYIRNGDCKCYFSVELVDDYTKLKRKRQ